MTDRRININRPDVWSDTGFPMNQAVVEPTGHRIHLTGQVAWDANFNVIGLGDAGAQTAAALDNIARVLETAGGTLDDIVSLTTYFTREEDKDAITLARKAALKKEFGPAATGIRVAGLWHKDLLVELTAIAVIPVDRFKSPEEEKTK